RARAAGVRGVSGPAAADGAPTAIDWARVRADFPIVERRVHGKPLVFGHTHRVPNGATTFYWSDPVVSQLAAMAYGSRTMSMPPGIDVPAHLAGHGIGHVTLHQVPGMLEGETYRRMRATLIGHFGSPVYEDSDMVAFATRPHVGAQLGR
ncbi:MAG: hypothetical protein ACK46X_08580, partial [Candidatus Sericytochromatia bacterium]